MKTQERQKPLIRTHNVDWNSKDDVWAFIDKMWGARSSTKWPFERQWFKNIAWFCGEQYLRWNDWDRRMMEPEVPSWRVRLVANLLLPVVRTSLAKTIRNEPIWTCIPASSEEEDIQVAALAERVLSHYWKYLDMPVELLDSLYWMFLTGNCFIKAYWDPDKGRIGELVNEIVSPFHVIPDNACEKMKDCQWILQSKRLNLTYISERYGKKWLKELVPGQEATVDNWSFLLRRIAQHMGPDARSYMSNTAEPDSEFVIVHELYRVRSKGVKNGYHGVFCQGHALKHGKYPFEFDELNFIHLEDIHVPGRFWATSTVEQLCPLQENYNSGRSQLAECRNMMSKPKWLVPVNSGVKEYAITSEPGEKIYYNWSMKPEVVQPTSMPAYVENIPELDRRDIQDISGQHEVSRAQVPGSVRAGIAIAALQEQDNTQLAPVGKLLDQRLSQLGKLDLKILHQYVKEPRLIRITGQEKEIEVRTFMGIDLVGDNYGLDYFDIEVQSFSQIVLSRLAQQQMIDSLTERGYLNPITDRTKVLNLLGIGDTRTVFDEAQQDRSRAAQENLQMVAGNQIVPREEEDHDIHQAVHNRYRKTEAFKALDPKLQQMFMLHDMQHEQLKARKMMKPLVIQELVKQQLFMELGLGNAGTGTSTGQGTGQGTGSQGRSQG